MPKKKEKESRGFIYRFGTCWIGPQQWHVEFVDSDVEASFRKMSTKGTVLELGKTVWYGPNNLIRLNAAMLFAEHPEEIFSTLLHEIGHVVLEGKWAKCYSEINERQVEDILCALDAPLGQALITLGLVDITVFDRARQAYREHLNGKAGKPCGKEAGRGTLASNSPEDS